MIGVTAGGVAGGMALTSIDSAIDKVSAMAEAALQVNKDVLVLGHGGPFNDAASVELMLMRSRLAGYVTGSTGERIPVEKAVAQAVREFKRVRR
jgi:predicted TIM-barrel enzyme